MVGRQNQGKIRLPDNAVKTKDLVAAEAVSSEPVSRNKHYQSLFFANAFPDPDLKYHSSMRAVSSVCTAM
jgi:hypothetical protein